MIQIGSYINILDNSGAKKAFCIKILNSGYNQRYAYIGSIILVSIKSIRYAKNIKIKKGGLHKAVLIKTKFKMFSHSYNYKKYYENSAVLLHSKQNKLLGTRIFSFIPKYFKYTKFLKLTTLSLGLSL
jgi:large subunit ribosomal protein L14